MSANLILSPSVKAKIPHAKVPLKYDEAINALVACRSVDEAKYYSDKADALAAWAKIYADRRVADEARKLKTYAYARMGELARELAPLGRNGPAPQKVLKKAGLSEHQARNAIAISRAPHAALERAVESGKGVLKIAREFRWLGASSREKSTDAWLWLTQDALRLYHLRSAMRSRSARDVASQLSAGESATAKELIIEIQEWLDELEQFLPKPLKKEASPDQKDREDMLARVAAARRP